MMDDLTESDRIERDLAQTRARMDSRLDELQGHLNPKQMLNDAFGYFRGGDGGAFASDLVARAKANPIPVALTVIGIAWLMASKQDAAKPAGARSLQSDAGQPVDDAYAMKNGQQEQVQKGTKQMAHTARETFSSISSNAFALGALAGVVGLVAGFLIPVFDQEEAALGSVATRVRTAGRDLAQDVVDRGGRIANDTVDAVKDSAQAHGLTADRPVGELIGEVTSGNIGTTFKGVAQETLQAGKDSLQHHVSEATQTGK